MTTTPKEIMWWAGMLECRVCSHRWAGVIEVWLAHDYEPRDDCECPNCECMTGEPVEVP